MPSPLYILKPPQDLLYRRSRSLVDYENANKALDKARAKNRDVLQAETNQQLCCQKFEKISDSAKQGKVFALAVKQEVVFVSYFLSLFFEPTCFVRRAGGLQDKTSGRLQEEPGGTSRAGAETRQGTS